MWQHYIMARSTSTLFCALKHASTLKENESDVYRSSHSTDICTLVHWSLVLSSGSTPTRRTAASGIPLGWRTRWRPRPVLLLHAPGPPAANRRNRRHTKKNKNVNIIIINILVNKQ